VSVESVGVCVFEAKKGRGVVWSRKERNRAVLDVFAVETFFGDDEVLEALFYQLGLKIEHSQDLSG
jgi:hypothetical protein